MSNKLLTVEFYVPSMDKNSIPISGLPIIRDITKAFGGCTVYQGSGRYVMADGATMIEAVSIVRTFVPEDRLEQVSTLAAYIKDTLNQETVLFTVNMVPTFI